MKKIFTILAMGAMVLTAGAQKTVLGSGFFDNWSITLQGGAIAPTVHHNMFSDARGVAGLELTKQITPVFGLGFQSMAGINTEDFCSQPGIHGMKTAIDHVNASVLSKFNFSNWFCGYNGQPRTFEVEGVFGLGFMHSFDVERNAATSTAGLNFNFNLGAKKAWTVSVKPSIVWDLSHLQGINHGMYNINYSAVQVLAGVTYHFKNHNNGEHYFTLVRPYDQAEVDGLNAKINDLRAENEALRNRKPEVKEVIKEVVKEVKVENNTKDMEQTITFRQGKSTVEAAQMPNVERVATFLKNNKDSKVCIKGYASPEGSKAINDRLAKERAQAVKNILVNKYKIAADRITAEGRGVGDMFSEPDWNRVSICTLSK